MTNTMNQAELYYESMEFNLPTAQTDYDLKANQTNFMTKFGVAASGSPDTPVGKNPTQITIRTNQTISFKLNATTADAITVASTDSPFTISGVAFNNVYLTNNSGSTAAIKILVSAMPY